MIDVGNVRRAIVRRVNGLEYMAGQCCFSDELSVVYDRRTLRERRCNDRSFLAQIGGSDCALFECQSGH